MKHIAQFVLIATIGGLVHGLNVGLITGPEVSDFFNQDKVFLFYMVLIIAASMPGGIWGTDEKL